MRSLLPAFLLIALCGAAHAEPPSDASLDALFAATRTDRMLEGIYGNMMTGIRQGIDASLQGRTPTPEQQRALDALPGKLSQIMREELSWAKLQPVVKKIYRESFTQAEIDGALAFYRSPAGAAIIEKMPAVQQKSQAAVQPFIPPMVQRIDAVMKQTLGDLAPAR